MSLHSAAPGCMEVAPDDVAATVEAVVQAIAASSDAATPAAHTSPAAGTAAAAAAAAAAPAPPSAASSHRAAPRACSRREVHLEQHELSFAGHVMPNALWIGDVDGDGVRPARFAAFVFGFRGLVSAPSEHALSPPGQ